MSPGSKSITGRPGRAPVNHGRKLTPLSARRAATLPEQSRRGPASLRSALHHVGGRYYPVRDSRIPGLPGGSEEAGKLMMKRSVIAVSPSPWMTARPRVCLVQCTWLGGTQSGRVSSSAPRGAQALRERHWGSGCGGGMAAFGADPEAAHQSGGRVPAWFTW